ISQGTETLAEYAYDFQGRRVKKTVGGMTTCYVYDADNNLIAEIAGDGTPLRDYIYLGSEPVAMKVYGAQAGIYYFLNDHPGTPQKIVDSTGTMVWEAAYLPFGQAQMLVATITNNLRFPGQYFDAETGLHYNWHRYYDPSAGRYLTPDPIGLDGGINLYAYANNNPVNWIDPSGLFVEGLYNSATGQLNLVDLDTGNSVAILAESGGKPFGAPIPPGTYDILDRQGRLGFYRLDRRDATPYNDIDDTSGRDHFRLHRPGRTTGCVAAKDDQGWKAADDLIRNTPSTDFVPDNFKPWWKIWPTRPEYIRRFGTLTVH
ncbi:MAG: RHS domain-containing protein, partial [Desulfobulbaceae bacterium]|nr:RHS domain-containing protein [Desulfobulbaceae bacterium]